MIKMDYEQYKNRVLSAAKARVWDPESGEERNALAEKTIALDEKLQNESTARNRAELIAFVLDNTRFDKDEKDIFPCDINACGIIADKIRMKDVAIVENGVMNAAHLVSLKASTQGIFNGWFDFSHLMPDWESVYSLGLTGLKARLNESRRKIKESGAITDGQEEYFCCGITTLDALIRYILRREKAERAYGTPESLAAADAFRAIATDKPQTLYQAMLLCFTFYAVLTFVEGSFVRSLGALDQLFAPLYYKDIELGASEEDENTLIDCFYVKWQSMNVAANIPFYLGGSDENGRDKVTDFSRLLVERYARLDLISPKMQIRVNKNTPDDFINGVLKSIRSGNSSFVFCNDDVIIPALEKIGEQRADAVNYALIGCYEPLAAGKEVACSCNALINLAKVVEAALNGGKDLLSGEVMIENVPTDYKSFDDFKAETERIALECAKKAVFVVSEADKYYNLVSASPLFSATFNSSVEKGLDLYYGGAKYNNSSINIIGLASYADSLAAVKKFVFDEKIVTLGRLDDILKNDWAGADELLIKAQAQKNRFGNDSDEPDSWAKDVFTLLSGYVNGRKNGRGGVFRTGLFSVDNCYLYGKRTGAGADGRLAREPISKNLCASVGKDISGVTAVMNAVRALGLKDAPNGAVLDVILHPSAVSGEDGLNAFRSLLKAYFAGGGQSVHFNVFSAETLIDAKKHPEKYASLQVRVCGWNAYFTSLSEVEQDAFIASAKNC